MRQSSSTEKHSIYMHPHTVQFDTAKVAPFRRRGRGAPSNTSGRFEPQVKIDVDDGWQGLETFDAFKTDTFEDHPKTIITKNSSPDISFDQSINPYQGCEHGCIYCFARPTHAYYGLSAGLDFESKIFLKPNAAELLEEELSDPNYIPRTIAIGTNTDPYQPIERKYRIMRSLLQVLERHSHPVGIVTKSQLITRDIDILSRMARKNLVKVALSVTSLDHHLSRKMEPRASAPEKRLQAVEQLSEAGIPISVMVAPIIPSLNESELEDILKRASAAGATEAGYILLRLPHEVRDLFREWLLENFPDRASRVMSLLRQSRQGKDYDATWGTRLRGSGPLAWAIGRRFEMAAKRFRLNQKRFRPTSEHFVKPVMAQAQMELFG